jgi:hypothetical protein
MAAWSDEPLDEREFPDEEDLQDDEDDILASIIPCPCCGSAMHEDSPQCPQCKEWITRPAGSWRSSGKWYVRGGKWASRTLLMNWLMWIALGLLAVLAILMGRG